MCYLRRSTYTLPWKPQRSHQNQWIHPRVLNYHTLHCRQRRRSRVCSIICRRTTRCLHSNNALRHGLTPRIYHHHVRQHMRHRYCHRQHQAYQAEAFKSNRHAISLDPGSRQAIAIYNRVYSYPTKLGRLLHQESTIRISSTVSSILGSHIYNRFRIAIDTIILKFQSRVC